MSTNSKKLYVVVHHSRDTHQPWPNSWLDDKRLEAIETTTEIGRLCQDAKQRNEPVFAHRCAWGSSQPLVCSSASVAQAASIDPCTSLVTFEGQQVLNVAPPVSPYPGQSYYVA